MARTGFTLTGSKAMQRRMRRLTRAAGDQVAQGLRLEAERVMTISKRDNVPVDLGPLRASGHVKDVERRGKDLSVTLGFGGPAGAGNVGETNKEDVGYAIIQHENLHFSHRVGGPKYLERPLRDAVPLMAKRIAKRINLEGTTR